MRVLVVDDDPDICELVAETLTDDGQDVVLAANGLEALVRFGEQRPDLILLDLRMPVMDGPTFARRCRERFGAEVPIIVMSAHRTEYASQDLRPDAFLAKPFDLDKLTTLVHRFVA